MIGIIEEALSEKRGAGSQEQGSGGPVSRRAVIDQRPASAADMDKTWSDISKAKRLLGWAPEISPEEGFRRSVEWHIQNRDWLDKIKV